MCNTNIDNGKYDQLVNIKPACCGLLQKSHPRSFFKQFDINSRMADWILSENPCLKRKISSSRWETYMDIIVLQVMAFGVNEFLCELVDVKEFESDAK